MAFDLNVHYNVARSYREQTTELDFMHDLKCFFRDERGITAIEYGIFAAIALITLVSIVASFFYS